MDDATMQTGLLMESAQTHQKLAEISLERMEAHTRGLDTVVRGAIRQAPIEELRAVYDEARRAEQALRAVRRAAHWTVALLGAFFAILIVAIGYAMARWLVPSPAEIAKLRANAAQLRRSKGFEVVRVSARIYEATSPNGEVEYLSVDDGEPEFPPGRPPVLR